VELTPLTAPEVFMEEKQNVNSQPSRIERFTSTWHVFDKKKWVTICGVVVTISTLVVIGLRKGIPWYLGHK
jgi:hypothetical protein